MGCGYSCTKWLLFLFNFVFALCGLAFLIIGVITHLKVKNVTEVIEENVTFPSIALIVVGAIIFTIAFFGCCGAIRESHCMTITFAMLLLTILVIQVAIAIFAFMKLNGITESSIRESYTKAFNKYKIDSSDAALIDFTQSTFQCCGINSYHDWEKRTDGTNIPWSCCEHDNDSDRTNCTSNYYPNGCLKNTVEFFKYSGALLGGVAIGIATIELIGIIFALCLANSIKNISRRGYRV